MKRLLMVAALLMMSGCAAQKVAVNPPPPVNRDWTISIQWNFDFTNFAQCSATLTQGCISSFTWGYLTGSTEMPVKTLSAPIPACTATLTESCIQGTTQPVLVKDQGNSTLGIGSVTFFAHANFVNNSGAAGSTADATYNDPTGVSANSAISNLSETRQ